MKDKVFVDTNILIYSYSIDEKDKQKISNDILEQYFENIIISKQVVNEVSNILFKKFKLSTEDVENVVLELDSTFQIINFELTTIIKAIRLKNSYNLQYYDSLIVATALENGCNILFSEDMQDNQIIDDTLKIINPFKNILE